MLKSAFGNVEDGLYFCFFIKYKKFVNYRFLDHVHVVIPHQEEIDVIETKKKSQNIVALFIFLC
jgi:hypothetical protein